MENVSFFEALYIKTTNLAEALVAAKENWNGTGYPHQLQGERIPLVARALFIVDSFCAMMEERPHRHAMTKEEALAQLQREAHTKYDPKLVMRFVNEIA